MCGIIGATSHIEGTALHDALLAIAHRGPDSNGIKTIRINDTSVLLGHTRLAILDLSPAGHQPMKSHDDRWWVTFNGEIYNHLDLRTPLNVAFRGHSDTETLVELIAAFGIDAVLPQLNGMFAFAALDTVEKKLYLVRDPFGIKPLYYAHTGNGLFFASEIKALLKTKCVQPLLNTQSLQDFLSLRYTPSPHTLWQNIQRLRPGNVYEFDLIKKKPIISYYIQPNVCSFEGSLSDAVSEYQNCLERAIDRQMISDVPVGILLSGGIDSAVVAAMACKNRRSVPCFTVGYGRNNDECEIIDAEATASVLNLPIHSVEIDPNTLLESLPNIIRAVEEPLGTTSVIPMWFLVKRAREDVTVVLTGQGTDEPWGGYLRYQVEFLRKLLPAPTFWKFMHKCSSLAGNLLPDAIERGLRTLQEKDPKRFYMQACALFTDKDREALTGTCIGNTQAFQAIQDWAKWLSPSQCNSVETMMRIDSRTNLADDLLLYGDKISMAASLEARVPMLDLELMRFVESLPLPYRVSLGQTKIVHKMMASRYLPPNIVKRKKKGFQVPFGQWARGPWRDCIEDVLFSTNSAYLSYFDKKAVAKYWNEHLKNHRDRSRQIFALFMIALWYQEFFSPN